MSQRVPPLAIRAAILDDIPEIVQIHTLAFPGFFMTILGPSFLAKYYRRVLAYDSGVFLIQEGPEGMEGFVSGFLHPNRFYREMREFPTDFLLSILLRLTFSPWLLPRLCASYMEARRSSDPGPRDECELSSIAVRPAMAGRGLGKGLLRAFVTAVQGRAASVILTTDAQDNAAVNRFYSAFGFQLERTYERSKGRAMNQYRYHLLATQGLPPRQHPAAPPSLPQPEANP